VIAAALLFPSFAGPEPPEWARRFLAEGGGGLTLFADNVAGREQLAALTASLRAEKADALLAIDEEGGDVTRLEASAGSSYPGNAALGAVDDVELTATVARAIGADLAAAGVDWNLAPVADVNVPGNPVIGVRAFGDDPALVARHTAAFVTGLQDAGVAACAKHFPGHGATEQDSHRELPVVTGELETGLAPFRAAVAAGVRSIMTAHVRVPALGDEPATVNARAIRLLRDELGFDGVVVTDALDMKGISGGAGGVEEAAVDALAAGADALCLGPAVGPDELASIDAAIAAALRTGWLDEARLGEAAERVAGLAAWTAGRGEPADRGAGLGAARRALLALGDVSVARGARVVELVPPANIAAGEHLHRFDGAVLVREGEPVPDAEVYVVRDAHRHAWMRAAADCPGAVVVEVGLPEWRPSRSRGYVATWGRSRVSLEAARERLGL